MKPNLRLPSTLASAPKPCRPCAAELTASQVIPFGGVLLGEPVERALAVRRLHERALRIEPLEHHRLAAKLAKAVGLPLEITKLEIGSGLANLRDAGNCRPRRG